MEVGLLKQNSFHVVVPAVLGETLLSARQLFSHEWQPRALVRPLLARAAQPLALVRPLLVRAAQPLSPAVRLLAAVSSDIVLLAVWSALVTPACLVRAKDSPLL